MNVDDIEFRTVTYEEWRKEAIELFGPDLNKWKFVCPVCGLVASVEDYKKAGAPVDAVGFSCIGRWMDNPRDAFGEEGPGPCNYAGGGFFRLNPVTVKTNDGKETQAFEFARGDNG